MHKPTRDPASIRIIPRNRSNSRPRSSYGLFPRNRSGDIPITILVIGVMIICALAIVSFFSSTIKERNSFVGIDLTEQTNAKIESAIFNNENPAGLYLYKNTTEGFLFWQKEVLLFSIEYKFKP